MLRARSLAIAASILVFASVFAGPEDLDGNGKIDLDDLTLLVDSWKKAKHGQPGWERADLNGDGRLDHADVAIFLDAFLRQYVPTATLADYMPLQTADVRLWQGEQGLVEAIETVASAGTPGVVEDKLVGMFNQELSRILWRVRNGRAVSLVGVRGGDTGFLFSPPDGVALPDSLQQGSAVTLPFEVQQENGGASGSGSLTLKLESMAESVDTPAGAFTNCLRLRVQLRFSVGSQQFSHDSVWWLAKNVGLVKRNVELYGSSTALSLAYAKVGSTVLGQRPTVNVAQDWPAPKDSLFIAEAGTALGGMRALANRSLGGVTVVPLANLELPLGTEADYWVVEGNNNYIRGRAGYRSGDQADDVFSPAFTWPGQVQLGQVVAGEGQVLHNGSPAGTYYASFAVVGVNQTVTVPAGTFTGCNVWCIGLGKKGPSGSLDEWGGMRVWMKPGVGPVQAEEWQGDAARPRETVLHTVFLRIGTGTSYGTQPTADYMALRKFDQYPCRRLETPEGRWRVYSVVGQTTVDGNRVWRETGAASWGQPPNDLLDEIWSDFYGTSGNSLIVPGYEPNPEEDLPLVTLVFRPTPRFPNPLPMGDPASVQCNIYRSDNNQLIGRLTATIMYCSNEDVSVPAGSFQGARKVQWQMSVVVGSDTEEFVGSEWLDRQAGLVRWATASPGEPQERWDAVWIKVGSKTWSHPGTFDIARYYPLDQGNDWRYGQRGQWWEEYLVLPPTTVGRYTDVRPLKFWESQHDPSQDYDVHYHKIDADAFRFVAYRPSDFPQILLLREPAPSWPRPWVIGQCVRSESAFVAGQLQAPYVQVAIPVAGGLRVDTPAGSFDQCVRIVGLRLIDARSVGEGIIWEHEDIIYAPDVGPVVRQYRGKEDNAYWGPGQLFWARVNGREYGTK